MQRFLKKFFILDRMLTSCLDYFMLEDSSLISSKIKKIVLLLIHIVESFSIGELLSRD